MPVKQKYRVWCNTDNKAEYVWKDKGDLPTTCPVNPAHIIDPSRTGGVASNEYYEGQKNFCVKEYQGRRLVKETWYEIDNGDDTYSQKVEEIVYNYNKNNLTSTATTTFWTDESPILTKTVEYFTNGNNIIVKNK